MTWSWQSFYDDSISFSKSLDKIGVPKFKSVNVMGFNSPEYAITIYGSIFHGNIFTGVYITSGKEACFYQAGHSEA